jgi:hypothetical protein
VEAILMPYASRCLLVLLGWWVVGCAAPIGRGGLDDFRIVSRGQDDGGDFCRDFSLTAAQAAWFFRRAEVLTAMQQHDRFDHLPCWVRGTARGDGRTWQWEVRAGGTARLIAPDGTARLLGCNDCDAVLQGREDAPPP